MKCAYHSDKDAVTKCSQCLKPICDECVLSGRDKDALCSHCAILMAAKDAYRIVDELREKREAKRQAIKAKGKRNRALLLVVTFLVAAVLVANFFLYIEVSTPNIKEFDPYQDLALTAGLINTAITNYAKDHEGKLPNKLNDIPRNYMPSEKITSSVFEKFSYKRTSLKSYELRVKDSDGGIASELIFTGENL